MLSIACTVNRLYLQPLLVMLASLVEHLSPGTRARLYLLHHDLTPADLEAIGRLVEVSSIVPPAERVAGLPLRRPFTREAYYPLLLPDVLPDSEHRVLFLDADVLVLDDLTPLWRTDLAGAPLAAVPDMAIPLVSSPRGLRDRRALGIPDAAPYFNAGVMLMDLAAWRTEAVAARAIDYLRRAASVDFLHQEALNAVLWDRWRPLDARWNLISGLSGRFGHDLVDRPAIVHYAGYFKPWLVPVGGPFGAPYRRYLARSWTADAPAAPPGWPRRIAGVYDRHLRTRLYPLEHLLWTRRLI